MKNLVIFASGSGTTFQYIIDAINNSILNANISTLIVNHKDIPSIERAKNHNIPYHTFLLSDYQNRKQFDAAIVNLLHNQLKPDLIVLAGWMHVFSNVFTSKYGHITINLHPALPGQFPGADGIGDAWKAYQNGDIDHTGAMIHYVTEELDAGEVIATVKVPIHNTDTLETLRERVRFHEKPLLLSAIQECLIPKHKSDDIYVGKVRNMHRIGYNRIVAEHSDRLSSFDRHICEIPCKGKVLTLTSVWWFNQTQHIIPNHLLDYQDNLMMVKQCDVIPIEVVIRGYITGSTQTSLWTHYKNGSRDYCGIKFPDGLVKNQRLDQAVVTPTTKGKVDVPISGREIVQQGILNMDDWQYIRSKALELFEYGTKVAKEQGLILVDTKYEFGRDRRGHIILIDEIHTCDSSRYWKADTYQQRFDAGEEPDRFDKDVIRRWIKERCDPYNEPLPDIPIELINHVSNVYQEFYQILTDTKIPNPNVPNVAISRFTEDWFTLHEKQKVIILSGSVTDKVHVGKIQNALKTHGIYSDYIVCSAHKNTATLVGMLNKWNSLSPDHKLVFVAVAGRSNALGAVLAANLKHFPVISCPPFKDKSDLMVNINSSLVNPSKVPVLVCLEPGNVAIAARQILDL